MSNSPRMKWPYPSAGANPWYDAFEGMVTAQDATATSLIEAKNTLVSGGGAISWDATTGTLAWAAPIVLTSPNTGYTESIPAGSTTVAAEGMLGFVYYVSFPTSNITLDLYVESTLPAEDTNSTFLLFRRQGTNLYFRNGVVLNSGQTITVFEGIGGVISVNATAPLSSSGGVTPTISLTGTVGVSKGGTGLTAGTQGGVPYFSGTTVLASSGALLQNRLVVGGGSSGPSTPIVPGNTGWVLTSNGTSSLPSFQAVSGLVSDASDFVKGIVRLHGGLSGLGSSADTPILNVSNGNVTGTLTLANGGTNNTLLASAGSVVYSDATKLMLTAVGTSGRPLISKGTAAPVFEALNLASAVAVTGVLPTANQAAQSLGGDLSGTTDNAEVAKLRGTDIAATLAPTAGQVLAWSGSAWEPATMTGGGGGGSGSTYYFNYGVDQPTPTPPGNFKQLSLVYVVGANSIALELNTSAYSTISQFITDADEPALDYIPPGIWQLGVYASSLNAASLVRFVVYRCNTAGTIIGSAIGTSEPVIVPADGVVSLYTVDLYIPATDVDNTDRIAVRIQGIADSGTPTAVVHYGGAYVSHLHTPLGSFGGTGLMKVVNGYPQSPATLLTDGDVGLGAIGVNKLNATATTAGHVLTTNGTTASWSPPAATGITSITAGSGLTGGTITTTGTVAVDFHTSGIATKVPRQDDARFNPTPVAAGLGGIAYSDGTAWTALASGSGTSGKFLQSNGAAAPSWATVVTTGAAFGKYTATASTAYTVAVDDYVVNLTASSGTQTVSLPAAVAGNAGRIIVIKLSGTATAIIDANGTQNIDDAQSISMSVQYTAYTLMSTGAGWIIL